MRVLRNLPRRRIMPTLQPATPTIITILDLTLLKSSPPEAIKLSRLNKRFTELLRECPAVVSPVKHYAEQMTRLCESQNATITIQAKQLSEQAELLHKQKRTSKGKRVRLDGVSVYTTAEVLRIARKEEAHTVTKKRRASKKKIILVESSTDEESEDSENIPSDFEPLPSPRGRYAVFSHVEV